MKLAVITGTTRGLGAELCAVYRTAGWSVIEISRPTFDLRNLDVDAAAASFTSSICEDAVFINNAASIALGSNFFDGIIIDQLNANFVNPIRLIERFVTAYPQGTILNITSGLARKSLPWFGLYCAAKAGMEGYIRTLQAQGYRAINFDPGVMATGMQETIRATFGLPDRQRFMDYRANGTLRPASEVADEIHRAHLSQLPIDGHIYLK